ncbi:MAG: hypothetical protein A2139_11320 [Desulfobacca sp. RBG_16_60_12]|nr:MAG: hypothetical protein A2139_11320 [Desulfobacca sp. RBG_16_60_12]
MSVITDPDNLNDGTEIVVTTGAKTVKLQVSGNLGTDGVTLKCVYSKLKDLWKTSSTYIQYPFPMGPITDEQFELINGWDFDKTIPVTETSATVNLIRTGGWALKDNAGVSQEEWAGIVTLGSLGVTDQVYYQQASAGAATNIVLQGAVNQAVKVYGDATHGNFDYRSYFKMFVREYQKIYASSQLSDIGVSTVTYQVYRFPLANGSDLKITHNDATVLGSSPYTGMTVTWYASPQARSIGGTNRNFHVIVDGNNGTAEQIYEYVQYELRQSADIDQGAGTKTGKTAADLLRFVGDSLYTLVQPEGGVYIDNFQANDTNRLTFVDDLSINRTFPYVAALTIQFGETLQNDASAIYHVYFTNDDAGDNTGRDFGTATAITVNDQASVAMSGTIGGAGSISKTFDYDGNVQRGAASAGTDAPITVVAIGLNTAQYVKAAGTIGRSIANVISLVAPLERNYQNL